MRSLNSSAINCQVWIPLLFFLLIILIEEGDGCPTYFLALMFQIRHNNTKYEYLILHKCIFLSKLLNITSPFNKHFYA